MGEQGKDSKYRDSRHSQSVFERTGRSVARHPWYYIGSWLVVILVCVPALTNLGSVFSNNLSLNPLRSSDASVVAQNKLATEFPNASGPPSSSFVLLVSDNITSPIGKNATLAITQAIQSDTNIEYLGGVESLYTAYAGYLSLEAGLGLQVLGQALESTPSLTGALNQTISVVWGPAAAYVNNWVTITLALPNGTAPSEANWPAYVETLTSLNSSVASQQVLSAFYYGNNGTVQGFNQTATEASLQVGNITPFADASMLATFPTIVPTLFPNASSQALPLLVLEDLRIENMISWSAIQGVGAAFLGEESGLPSAWILKLWQAFPTAIASTSTISDWTVGITENSPISEFPLPIPPSLLSSFVSPGNNATMLIVAFTKPDNYTEAGQSPVFRDIDYINGDISTALHSSSDFNGIAYYQTGPAPLESALIHYATSTLGFLLAVTIVLLVVIMIGYFRAPAAPVVTFAGIGISLIVTLGVLYIVGMYVTTISSMLESILIVFLMAIVTDYSIFMMARYREELVEGRPSYEAVVSSVAWAGQSIATSGLTMFVVGLVMASSGISILVQLGIGISIAVVVAILMALTVIPSAVTLIGPRLFWPYTGARFERHAKQQRRGVSSGCTYFSKAGAIATKHPVSLVLVILLISIPVVFVALNVPVSYDSTNIGMPNSNPAQKGLNVLQAQFGKSSMSTSFVLVTFTQPLFANNSVNADEIRDISSLTTLMNSTPGVSKVSSLVGPGGDPLPVWLNLSQLPQGTRTILMISAQSYVGVDGRTVQFQIETNASGYSAEAGAAFSTLQDKVKSFQSGHTEVATVYFGGAAQATRDNQAFVNNAMVRMLLGVAIGIFVILVATLRAPFVPALALGAIGLSILWSWATVYFVVDLLEGISLTFMLPLLLIVLLLGLGMDYNALFLTRVQEERVKGGKSSESIERAVTHVGGVVTAAAIILGGPFLVLGLTSSLGLIAAAGIGIAIATLVQAFIAQTYLVPAILAIGKDRIWWGTNSRRGNK